LHQRIEQDAAVSINDRDIDDLGIGAEPGGLGVEKNDSRRLKR
jgi:hypothetical protein